MPPRKKKDGYLIQPDPLDPRLSERVTGVDQTGAKVETAVVVERALTIFLNSQEIVTAMTIGDYPDYLALGYLLNQNMLKVDDEVTGIDYDAADVLLKQAKWNVKAAIIMQRANLTLPQALRRLKKAHDSVREAIGEDADVRLNELLAASPPPARQA